MPHFLTSSLATPNTLQSISVNRNFSTKHGAPPVEPIVRDIAVVATEDVTESAEPSLKWGKVQKLAIDDGQGERRLLALAHSTSRLSLLALPSLPPSEEVIDDDDGNEPSTSHASIVRTYKTSAIKPSNAHVSLNFLPNDKLLHATSNGRLSLHSTAASDPSPSQTLRLPANLTSLLPSASATHFAYAGKEVDVSLWDIEAGFAGKGAEALEVEGGKKRKLGGGKKADKEKLMEGEVWRARNLPNDFLSLRPEVHHMCMTFLPFTPGSSTHTSTHPTHHIATGTSSGHVRTYDVRAQRRPVNNWKANTSGGGIGRISVGQPHTFTSLTGSASSNSISSDTTGASAYEIWYGESDSGKVGCLDSRTGRVLYAYNNSTATPSFLLPLSSAPGLLASLASDSLLSIYRTLPLPPSAKQTPLKGKLGVAIGGCEGGVVVGWEGEPWDGVRDERKEREEREDEEVWEGMQGTGGPGEDDDDDDESDYEGLSGEELEEDDQEDGVVVTVQDDASSEDEEEEEHVKVVAPKKKKAKGSKK